MAALNDVLEVTAKLSAGTNAAIQNVFHLVVKDFGGVPDENVPDDIGEYLEGIYDELDGGLWTGVSFVEYTIKNLTTDTDLGTYPWPTLTGGGSGDANLPYGVAGLVKAKTTNGKHQGRKFFGLFTEASNDGGKPNAAVKVLLAAAGAAAYSSFTSIGANDYQPGVLERDVLGVREVVSVVVGLEWAYQRRRKPGVGI